ncbi:uncharacterized protein I303_106409 [Kwoniella dejecticola CBS 10117]|uniref:Uncharacterized protein n=1 Tax=Kwoniella dejecticola CBS 10117 TaxID=1296121 RepID=A0A1A5ZUS4_9TREE|nr:uncharacterized protein I303_08332 [Kwoniella dejecticola CBS 10117]OBR81562.1 hypothetical protein I303_08332 [Kwoniella dejecticola CBS 10117]
MLKDIVERSTKTPVAPSAPIPGSSSSGFPAAVHRSHRPSAFAKARQSQAARAAGEKVAGEGKAVDAPPTIGTSRHTDSNISGSNRLSEVEQIRKSVQDENLRRVEGMSQLEREEEVEELKERFGSEILELMRRRQQARSQGSSSASVYKVEQEANKHPAREERDQDKSGPSSRPLDLTNAQQILDQVSEENWEKVESMDKLEREQEIEDLQERFGGKLLQALRKRAEAKAGTGKGKEREEASSQGDSLRSDPPNVSSSSSAVLSKPRPTQPDDPSLSELKQYFPSVPSEPSKLAWLQPVPASAASSAPSLSTRFDLSGNVLSSAEQSDLPQHLGLHHHGASPDMAGYTIQEILYLCRSTVPSQKITMMNTLSRIIHKSRQGVYQEVVATELKKSECIKRSIESGVEILAGLSRGIGVIESGINLLFEALDGPAWSWINEEQDHPLDFTADAIEGEGISSIPFEDVLPRLKELLSIEDGLSSQTINQLLLILRRATYHSKDLCEVICSLIPPVIRTHVTAKAWPPTLTSQSQSHRSYPSLEAMRLLRDTTASSRECAEDLLGQGVYETTLRSIVTATWSNDLSNEVKTHGQGLALEVLRTYAVLGRYGLSANIVTSSSEIWRMLGQWVNNHIQSNSAENLVSECRVIEAYFKLLEIWITCAIDPHRTTPEHDLTWAQVAALKWEEEGVSLVREAKDTKLLAAAIEMLCAWTKGIRVNGIKSGEAERAQLVVALGETRLNELLERVAGARTEEQSTERLLAAAVQLHRLLLPAGQLISEKMLDQLQDQYATNVNTASRYSTYLRYDLLILAKPTPLSSEWIASALNLFQLFQVGDEPLALELLDVILKSDLTAVLPEISQLDHADGLQVIRPLLQYQILPNVENVVSPYQPSHLYLKATSTLRQTPPSNNEEKPALPGLPLDRDWLWSPLNELLRSGTSEAIQQTPNDWQVSEVTLVQATLLLLKLCYGNRIEGSDRAGAIFGLMKVHMLEHGQTSSNAVNEVEVFRDNLVSDLMKGLMTTLCLPQEEIARSTTRSRQAEEEFVTSPAALEKISIPFLGTGVPFYQFYQDFLDLYESISFSDTLFTQLLLPVLSMDYPRDYRKLLWVDHFGLLKNVRLTITQIPLISAKGIKGYFEPYEEDKEILTAYARALTSGQVTKDRNPFLFVLAVNHLAALFWYGANEARDSARVGLMIMILQNGHDGLIKDFLSWDFESLVFKDNEEERKKRKEIVRNLTGERGWKRIEGL